MNPKSLENLSRKGRPTFFTKELVLALLHVRKWVHKQPLTAARFIQLCVEDEFLSRPVHPVTMRRLISGKLYPGLIDPKTSKLYEYGQVPQFIRGRPRAIEQAVDATGQPLRPLSPGREALKQQLFAQLKLDLDHSLACALSDYRRHAGEEMHKLRLQIESQQEKITTLQAQVQQRRFKLDTAA